MHLKTLFWFFEQLVNTRTLHSDENGTLIIVLPERRAFKNLSPHISPTTRADICCKVPVKSPYSPTQARDPPLGEADSDDKCIIFRQILPLYNISTKCVRPSKKI